MFSMVCSPPQHHVVTDRTIYPLSHQVHHTLTVPLKVVTVVATTEVTHNPHDPGPHPNLVTPRPLPHLMTSCSRSSYMTGTASQGEWQRRSSCRELYKKVHRQVQWNLSWEATVVRDHLFWKNNTYFWRNYLHLNLLIWLKPSPKYHLSWETTFLWPTRSYLWSFKTGSVVMYFVSFLLVFC